MFTISSILPLKDIFWQQSRYGEKTRGGEKENKTEECKVVM
jgi:hypothetical protein